MTDGAPLPTVGELARHGLYRSLASLEVFALLGGLYVACNVLLAAPLMDYQNAFLNVIRTETDSTELMRRLGELEAPRYNFIIFILTLFLSSVIAVLWLRTISFGREAVLAGGISALFRRSGLALLRYITLILLVVGGSLVAGLIVVLVGGIVGGLFAAFGLMSQGGVSVLLTVLVMIAIVTVMTILYVGFSISIIAATRDRSVGVLKALELAGPGRWRLFRCFVVIAALSIPAYMLVLLIVGSIGSGSAALWFVISGNTVVYLFTAYGGSVAVGFYDWLEPSLPAELRAS